MAHISGSKVWRALLADPLFLAEVPQEQWSVFKLYAGVLPEVLACLLDEPVSLESIMRARLITIHYFLGGGFVKKMTEALPEERLCRPRQEWIEMTEGHLHDLYSKAKEIIKDVPRFLEYICSTEEGAIVNLPPTLSLDNLRKLRVGELTIGDILVSQPYVVARVN
jgi:hypothetical protein